MPQQRYQNTYANLPRDRQRYNQYNSGASPSPASSMSGSVMGQRGLFIHKKKIKKFLNDLRV